MDKKVLIVVDQRRWAYDNIAEFIENNKPTGYKVQRIYINDYRRRGISRIRWIRNFWLYSLSTLKYRDRFDIVFYLAFYLKESIQSDDFFNVKIKGLKTIGGVYTSSMPPEGFYSSNVDTFRDYLHVNFDIISAGSQEILNNLSKLHSSVQYFNMSIESSEWKEFRPLRQDVFVFCWTGNPQRDFKGFYSHILPAFEIVRKRLGDRVVLKTRFSGPLKTLRAFYLDCNCLVLASVGDAGPSSFSEASLCGIPTIATRNGAPLEVIQNGKNGFLVEREIEKIADKMILIATNESLYLEMTKNIRTDYIKALGRKKAEERLINLLVECQG